MRKRGKESIEDGRGMTSSSLVEPIHINDISGEFSDYEQFLRILITEWLEFVDEVKVRLKTRGSFHLKKIGEGYSRTFEKIDKTRKKTEQSIGNKFLITNFLENKEFSKEEKTIVKILFSMNGLGVKEYQRTLTGREIMVILNCLYGTSPQKTRKCLVGSSRLREEFIMGPKKGENPLQEIGKLKFGLSEYALSSILGEEERAEKAKSLYDKITKDRDDYFKNMKNEKDEEGGILEKMAPDVTLDDVYFPDGVDIKRSILTTVEPILKYDKFLNQWGMKEIIGSENGATILLTGPSGCGKTMTAKALSNHIGWDIFYLPFDNVLSGLYGKTEENVKKIFSRLEEEKMILLVDEAEGLLSKRISSRNSVDATENRIKNIVLQELESHPGIVIFTTNLATELDKALSRRIDLKLEIPLPDKETRKKIWKNHIPDNLPLEEDIDLDELASHDMTGGEIKNVVVFGAKRAISNKRDKVLNKDFIEGIKREKNEAMDYDLREAQEPEQAFMCYN